MSARSFRSVFMVASCAGAALGCYLVSLRVASERSQLEDVETKIVSAQQDMRVLQTEIGTRGRLAQLERWNVKVLALSAPAAQQFVNGGYELAQLTRGQPQVDFQAPVVMASAPAPEHAPAIGQISRDDSGVATQAPEPTSTRSLIHQASYRIDTPEVPARITPAARPVVAKSVEVPKPVAAKPAIKPTIAAARPVAYKPAKPAVAAAAKPPVKKSVDKPAVAAAKPVTKPIRLARNDPLAPLGAKPLRKTAKDTGSAR
jgi:hypothetical protein